MLSDLEVIINKSNSNIYKLFIKLWVDSKNLKIMKFNPTHSNIQ